MRPLVQPTISLNGTSRDALLQQQINVLENLRVTEAAMREASPHMRDYGTHELYSKARCAWLDRLASVVALRRDVEVFAEELAHAD